MLRALLLFLSRQAWLRNWVEHSRLTGAATRRFIAGHSLDEELAVIRKLKAERLLATADYLGENVTSLDEARASRDSYLRVLDALAAENLEGTVSLKLTQLGLDLSEDACRENVAALAAQAARAGTRIEIDMESSEYTDRTVAILSEMHERFHAVRAVLQAYLRRSGRDVEAMNKAGIPVRLCKGAYDEPATVAFASKKEVDENYVRLAGTLLESGTYPAIASHDERMIEAVLAHVRANGRRPEDFEFQMLYGIRRDLQRRLSAAGYRVRLYVPFGDAWYPYLMRRLAERPANLLFLVRNVFRP